MSDAAKMTPQQLRRTLETKLRDLAVAGDIGAMRLALERLDGDAGSLAAQVNRLPAAALEALAARLDHTTRGVLLEAMGAVLPDDIRAMSPVAREQRLLSVKLELDRMQQAWPTEAPPPASGEPIIRGSVDGQAGTIAQLEEAAADATSRAIEDMTDTEIEMELAQIRTQRARHER